MNEQHRPARVLSTPMIKGELQALLVELVPAKRWPKRTQLKDLIAFTLTQFRDDTTDVRERRALDLARAIHDNERR